MSRFVPLLVPLPPIPPKGQLSAGLGEGHPNLETLSQVRKLQELPASPSSTERVGVGWEPALAAGTVSRGMNEGSLLPDEGHGGTPTSEAHLYSKSTTQLSPIAHIGAPTWKSNISH